MLMESKIMVYIVLAIALGYSLVSVVPNRLVTPQLETFRGSVEEIERPGVENKEALSDDEIMSAPTEDAATEDAIQASGLNVEREVFSTFKNWILNLLLRLAYI